MIKDFKTMDQYKIQNECHNDATNMFMFYILHQHTIYCIGTIICIRLHNENKLKLKKIT